MKQLQEASLLLHLYQNITELPLRNFIDLTVDGKLTALIRPDYKGEVPESILHNVRDEIYSQYADSIGDNEQRLFVSVFKEVTKLQATITQIYCCIEVLNDYYTEQFAKEVNKLLHTKFKFDTRFPDDYNNDLERCKKRTKELEIRKGMKEAQLKIISDNIESKSKGVKPTREYYITVLMNLSDFAKFPITEMITVYEFISRIQSLNKAVEKQK
jgi:hypothetical protein